MKSRYFFLEAGLSMLSLASGLHSQHPLNLVDDHELLQLTAVTSDAASPDARFECWQFAELFHQYPTVGKSLPLADLANITYVVLPPRSREGLHHPPSAMLFVLVSGMARVTLPSTNDEEGIWITQTQNQVIVANDLDGIGHNTEYSLDVETVALQLTFRDGKLPEHTVLHRRAC